MMNMQTGFIDLENRSILDNSKIAFLVQSGGINRVIRYQNRTVVPAGKIIRLGGGSSGNKGNGGGGSPSLSAAGYYGNFGEYPRNSSGSLYAAMDLQTKASYMSDQEIGKLENGWGLSGTQLERYQERQANVVETKVKHKICKADQEKAKTDWERTLQGCLKTAGGVVMTAVGADYWNWRYR